MTSDTTRILLQELKGGLKTLYGARLKAVYLYGSYARGEQDEESDIDVLVVLTDFDRAAAEIDRASELTAQLCLKYCVLLSKVFGREREWLTSRTPFLNNVRQYAVAV
jgi:predicted nucleotidyltransferase